jgi:class 3 adenylate cyclase
VPALVMHRTGDQLLKLEEGRYVASLIPGARFLELPGVDHLPFVGDQDEMIDEIEDFLTSIRFALEPERVLATVLTVGTLVEEEFGRMASHVEREIDWFRGRMMEARAGAKSACAAFDGPARAAKCAAAILRHAQRAGIAARAAVHSGECDTLDGRVTGGPAVEVAERIRAAAQAGDVLVSNTVRDLVAGSGIRFRERGMVEQWAVYRVEV